MCGIAGIVNRDNKVVDENVLKQMCDVMIYRGPDEDGYYFNKSVGLGMRRLKIIDLSTGTQPIYNEDKSIIVIFNGEIYNYLELREMLLKKGHRFYTQSDTEVIVHMYEDYGEDFITYLNGMFGIALYDVRKELLLLYRDRLGEKPLHYTVTRHGITFASEIKSILCDRRFQKEIDEEALYYYFAFSYIPAPHTIYKNVRKLLPGHYLRFMNGKIDVIKYWDVVFNPDFSKSEEYFSQGLRELLTTSVKRKMISDVPLGAFLSGGIDSTIIVGLMSTLSNQPVKTFSIGFDEESHNELHYARVVAEKYKTEHHEFVVKPSALGLINKLIRYFDEPFSDASAIPTFIVSELTKRHVTVALSGDGGDEIFGGYDSYLNILKRKKLELIPMFVRRHLLSRIGNMLPDFIRGKGYLMGLYYNNYQFFCNGIRENFNKNLFSPDFFEKNRHLDSMNIIGKCLLDNSVEYLSKFQYVDIKNYLPNDILVKVDRMSMANSLETRTPFLDHKIVEFAARIPARMKINGSITKYILKESMKDIIPAEIVNRRKQGFAIPAKKWLKSELKDILFDTIASMKRENMGFFNVNFLENILEDHFDGRKNNTVVLWMTLIFYLWYDNLYKK